MVCITDKIYNNVIKNLIYENPIHHWRYTHVYCYLIPHWYRVAKHCSEIFKMKKIFKLNILHTDLEKYIETFIEQSKLCECNNLCKGISINITRKYNVDFMDDYEYLYYDMDKSKCAMIYGMTSFNKKVRDYEYQQDPEVLEMKLIAQNYYERTKSFYSSIENVISILDDKDYFYHLRDHHELQIYNCWHCENDLYFHKYCGHKYDSDCNVCKYLCNEHYNNFKQYHSTKWEMITCIFCIYGAYSNRLQDKYEIDVCESCQNCLFKKKIKN